ncbi:MULTISPECIES: O-antigen polymerase [Microbacterium]|uniref:O-antigen polymerase n=1 Tax=Microbacterium TaxID=33882 RepID=UPI0025F251FB|nr:MULTISPECIES: oligosaccharide repeat unit polymerase [Microbacterium]
MTDVSNGIGAFVLVAVLLGLTTLTWFIARRAFLPVAVHNGVWAVTLVLVGSGLIAYHGASIAAWGVLLVGLLFFSVGAWGGVALAARKARSADLAPRDHALVSRRVLLILAGAYALGFGVYVWTILQRFGWETFWFHPETIRGAAESYLAGVPLWARLLMYVGPLLLAILIVPGSVRNGLAWWWRAPAAVLLAVSMLALLQRTNLFAGVLLAIGALLLLYGRARGVDTTRAWYRRPWVPVAAIGAIGVGALLAFQVLAGALGKTGDVGSNVSPALSATGLSSPFIYLTAGVPAFLSLVDSTNGAWPAVGGPRIVYGDYDPQTFGTAFFEPVLSLIPGLRTWNPVAPFVDVGTLTNVYTWLEPFYRDWRVVGVALGAAAIGVLVAYLYATRRASPARWWLSALLVSTLFLVTFTQKTNNTLYLVTAAIIVVLGFIGSRRRSTS